MILIFSEAQDSSTNLVLDWLLKAKANFIRVNYSEPITVESYGLIEEEFIRFRIGDRKKVFQLSDFRAVWYRRSIPSIDYSWRKPAYTGQALLDENIQILFDKEKQLLREDFLNKLSGIPSLGSPYLAEERKMRDLRAFKSIGGLVPRTLITTQKKDVLKFYESTKGNLIFKKLNYSFYYESSTESYFSYTEILEENILREIPERFGATLFQENISKCVELRIFVLGSRLYCMAIWSQANERTLVDFRHYDEEKPNRFDPFLLPEQINDQIHDFMSLIGTNCGSIDMILTPKGDYVFLELNPIGQFGMISQACNFNFEKEIANELITYCKNSKHH